MTNFNNINDVLDFAIGEEQAAIDFYLKLADMSRNEQIKKIFHEFAEEEMKHKAKLMDVKVNGAAVFGTTPIMDLKLSDYLVDVKPSPDMSYEEALILAMKKEKAAFKLYTALAGRALQPGMQEMFRHLAMEESKHKMRFEIEYDDYILREN
ncbi:MAG: ferritin family protein [Bacteroidales bacterium]|nr:ferritin family protein [Bacteroidales bacterium]